MYTQVTAKTKETRHTVDNEWASKCVSHTQSVTQTNAKPDEKFRHESATNMQGSSSQKANIWSGKDVFARFDKLKTIWTLTSQ